LFIEAISFEASLPRLYEMEWLDEALQQGDGARRLTSQMSQDHWRSYLGVAREVVVGGIDSPARAAAAVQSAQSETQVIRGEVAGEAIEIVPSEWRNRIQPFLSVRLPCQRAKPLAAPSGDRSAAFAIVCMQGLDVGSVSWRDHEGREVAAGQFPLSDLNHAATAIRGTNALLLNMYGRDGAIELIDAGGEAQRFLPSDWGGRTIGVTDVSPTGRYLALYGGTEILLPRGSAVSVLDMLTGTIIWAREDFSRPGDVAAQRESFGFLWERGGEVFSVQTRRDGCQDQLCSGSTLVLLNLRTGTQRPFDLPQANAARIRRYGDDAALIHFNEGGRAVVSLVDGAVSHLSNEGQLPFPTSAADCGVRPIITQDDNLEFAAVAAIEGRNVELIRPIRSTAEPECAVSADGSRLVVIARPFMHFYAISPPR
jgi:hypothetical protein